MAYIFIIVSHSISNFPPIFLLAGLTGVRFNEWFDEEFPDWFDTDTIETAEEGADRRRALMHFGRKDRGKI